VSKDIKKNCVLTRPCPLCRSTAGHLIEKLHFVVFDGSAISGDCALVTCSVCGFAFHDTSSSQADFDRYYQQNAYYYTATAAGTGGSSSADIKRFEKLYERIASLIPNKQAAIFDVGCAKGGFLNILVQQEYTHLYGVDMLPECVEHIRDTLVGVSAATGSALELPFPEIHADLLVYSHIVEHVIDLVALVQAAHEKLSDCGIVYVEVPDATMYRAHSIAPYQDLYIEHVNHFSPSTLVSLFITGGFDTIATGQFEFAAHPLGKVPCIWAVFRKSATTAHVKPDWELERHLIDYIAWSKQHQVHKKFTELALTKTPLYLWGISQHAMLMMGQTALCNCNIKGFVDKDPTKRKRKLLGYPIEAPEILHNAEPGCAVLITAPGYEKVITKELKAIDFKGIIIDTSGVEIKH
jgi:SAM-dependent methyltransferase